jgi:hypothetical protein
MAEHADFVVKHAAAIQVGDLRKVLELASAVTGAEFFCEIAKYNLSAHRATHSKSEAA